MDGQHALAYLIGLASVCSGTYLLAGMGAALIVLGTITMAMVIYARTRGSYDRRTD